MSTPDERKRTVVEELRRIRLVGLLILGVFIAVLAPTVIGVIRNTNRVDLNAQRIDQREHIDAAALRAAAWRGCARDMLERADQYATQQSSLKAPGLRKLFPRRVIEEAVERRRHTLPIFNCDPNLCGDQPTVLAARVQRRFVEAYRKRELDPNPAPPKSGTARCPIPLDADPLQLRI